MGERRLRAASAAGLADDPGDRPGHRRRRDAARRAAGEPAPPSSSTRWRRRRPTSSCWRTSAPRTRSWPARIGRSRSQITNTIRLLNLPPPVQRRVAAGVLSAGHARALLGLDDAEAQDALATRIVAEGLSVRAIEELVRARRADEARRGSRRRARRRRSRAGARRPGRPALRPLRHPGQGRPRPAQGQDHRRVRLGRRPRAHRRPHGSRAVTSGPARPASEPGPGRAAQGAPARPPGEHASAGDAGLARRRRSPPAVFAGFGAFADYNAAVGRACGRRPTSSGSRTSSALDSAADGVWYAEVTVTAAAHGARLGSDRRAGRRAGRAAGWIGRGGHRDTGADRPLPRGGRCPGPRSRCGWRRIIRMPSSGSAWPGTRRPRSRRIGRWWTRAAAAGVHLVHHAGETAGADERAGGVGRRPGRADRAWDPVAGGSRAGGRAAGRAGAARGVPVVERGPRPRCRRSRRTRCRRSSRRASSSP